VNKAKPRSEFSTVPFWTLIDSVREAIKVYDKSKDHTPHDNNSDCVRCALVAALGGVS
jgi:hypothetical protein